MNKRATARAARRQRVAEAWGHAAAAIGPITEDLSIFLITRGQFSMLDMVRHCLDQLGPASISVWTWAIADYEVEGIAALMADRRVVSARLVIDRSAEHRHPGVVQLWRDKFGAESVRVCANHAKLVRVWSPARRVLIRGSMNLNNNPRFEQADITVNGEDFDLIERLEAELPILAPFASHIQAEAASQVGRAWEHGSIEIFRGMRTWRQVTGADRAADEGIDH